MARIAALLVAPLALLLACAPAPEPVDGADGVEQARQSIRNGTREPEAIAMTEGQILALGWLHPVGQVAGNFCTATLITPRVVATASHCTEGRRGDQIGFGIGLLPNQPTASFRAIAKVEHPQVDAALLILGEDATERVPELTPIRYNRTELDRSYFGREVQAGGYGETYDRSRYGRYFATVEFRGLNGPYLQVDGRGRQGICFGDSGGPVITLEPNDPDDPNAELVVLGVESFGDQSCVGIDNLTRLDLIQGWIESVLADPPEAGEDPCRGVDFQGRCTGDIAEWCDNGSLRRRDCTQVGETCGFVNDEIGYFCRDAPRESECGDLDFLGACEGNVAVWCADGRVRRRDCGETDEFCQYLDPNRGYYCDPDEPDPDAMPPEPEPGDDEPTDDGPTDDEDPEPPAPGAGADGDEPGNDPDADAEDGDEPEAPNGDDPAADGEQKSSSGGCSAAAADSNQPGHLPLLALMLALGLRGRRRQP